MMARYLGRLFLFVLLTLFGLLLIQTAAAPHLLALGVAGSWFTWGMLLFLGINVLAVVFAIIYLWARGID